MQILSLDDMLTKRRIESQASNQEAVAEAEAEGDRHGHRDCRHKGGIDAERLKQRHTAVWHLQWKDEGRA
jgi:hypothetical protein